MSSKRPKGIRRQVKDGDITAAQALASLERERRAGVHVKEAIVAWLRRRVQQ